MKQLSIQTIKKFTNQLPSSDLIFAYGSAVQSQANYDYAHHKPMIDLIISVDDTYSWHQENLRKNSKHYTGLGYLLGHSYIERMNHHIFPIHFTPFVQFEDQQFKYGVVSTKQLIKDLEEWRWLSIAGRMHKPILTILEFDNDRYKNAYKANLCNAVTVSLLLDFKEITPIEEFLFNIVSLSYVGDVRFSIGAENQNKIVNILKGNYNNILNLYLEILPLFKDIVEFDGKVIKLKNNNDSLEMLLNAIPERLTSEYFGAKDVQMTFKMMNPQDIRNSIVESLKKKNSFASKRMILYNMMMISPILGVKYGLQKIAKNIK